MKNKIKKFLSFFFNPHFMLCFGIAWLITNGWAYILLLFGGMFHISWMVVIASGYLAILWIPCTPEKIITVSISVFLLKKLFPEDERTLLVLKEYYQKVKNKFLRWKEEHKRC